MALRLFCPLTSTISRSHTLWRTSKLSFSTSNCRFKQDKHCAPSFSKTESETECHAAESPKSLPYLSRRAVMYIPGDDARKIAKIPSMSVDCPVLECEDGVAQSKKDEARKTILATLNTAAWIKERKSQGKDVAVRVNSIQSGLVEEDLKVILSASTPPSTLLVPKIEEKDHVGYLSHLLSEFLPDRTAQNRLRLILYIESAAALLKMPKIIKAAVKLTDEEKSPFLLEGAVLGSDDFCADIGATRTQDAMEVIFARQFFVTTLKSFQRGLQAIDLVHINYKDLVDLKRQAEEGARWGFTGKQIIHPAQIDTVQAAFSPSAERLLWAKELVAEFDTHQKSGKGAFTFRNSMIDRPLLLQAQNILAQEKLLTR